MLAIKWITALLTASLLSPIYLLAVQQLQFEHLSLEHGLSQSSVYAIAQDQQGFIWIGTQDGLNKYDGYTFTVYHNIPWDSTSLSNNYIRRLLVDHKGRLWVGTNGGGVNYYDPQTGKFTRYLHDPGEQTSLSSNEVWSLFEDHQGAIWVGTRHGLNAFDETTQSWRRYYFGEDRFALSDENYIRSIYEDVRGSIWIGQTNGITQLDPKTGEMTRLTQFAEVTTWIVGDSLGMMWRATGSRVQTFDSKDAQPRTVVRMGSDAGVFGQNHIGWFGTYSGLVEYNLSTGVQKLHAHDPNRPESLSENSVLALLEDRSGILWVGTHNGINKYIPTKKLFTHYIHNPKDPVSLSSIRVRAFSEDRFGAIWIATQYGLNRFNPKTKQFFHYNAAPGYPKTVNNELFWSVLADHMAQVPTVWAGTNGGGVNKLEFPRQRSFENPVVSFLLPEVNNPNSLGGNVIECMLLDHVGMLWTGALGQGVTRYDSRLKLFRQFRSNLADPIALSHGNITVLYETRDSTIWVGTFGGGLNKLNREQTAFTRYLHDPYNENSLSDNIVQSIYEDHTGILWIGTYGGLNRFDRTTESFWHYSTKDGLPNNVIYAILEDGKNNLWLSSNAGLTRFNPQTMSIRNYSVHDGLQSNEFNHGAALRASTGEMYFGGINGFNVFQPDSITDNPHIPAVVFTELLISNKRIEPGESERRLLTPISTARELFLSYDDAVLTFRFAALEFTNPTRNQHAYMMDGFDQEWTYAGTRREATYTNLDPGSYTFRVKASNNDGVWNEIGASIAVHIAPPFWMTWWFRGIVVLAFLSVGPFMYYRRVATLKQQHTTQQEFSRKLIESQEAERKRIASELHDSIGQDLLIIKNRLLLTQESGDSMTEVKHALRDVTEYVSKSLGNVRTISRNLRPVQLDQLGLTTALEAVVEAVAESSQIQTTTQLDSLDGLLHKEAEINLFRIVQESLNNIVKHSGAEHITLILKRGVSSLDLTITDNGKGISASAKKGLGVTGMAERARILGGTFSLVSNPGHGTTVQVNIPLHEKKKTLI